MHILLIHQAFMTGDEAGGTRHYELARHLIQAGHRFTAVASMISYLTGRRHSGGDWLAQQQVEGITLYRSYTHPALHRSFVHRVASFLSFMVSSLLAGIRVRGVDVVWGTSPPIFQGITAWLLTRLKQVPFVFEVRDLWPAFAVDMGVLRNPILIWAAEWLECFLYRHADHLVVNSPAYVDHVWSKGVSVERVTLVSNGVETATFDPEADGAAVRREFGLDGRFVVLYAGAHGPANDLGIVLQAADRLRDRTDIAFVLVGDGKEKQNLVHQAEEMALSNVYFIPAQPKSRMPEFLAAADAGLAILKDIPMFTTTYPNKVFDYMAAGRPTILAIDGVIRQVVEAAKGGVFVPPGDPVALAETVRNLAGDRDRCLRMGRSARAYVEAHFERVQQAEKLERVLTSLVGQGKGQLWC
jgi:glycosyltransferase involved in cell wall biosynthesis